MENRIKNIAKLQTALVLLPVVIFLWLWSMWLGLVIMYGAITTGQLVTASFGNNLLVIAVCLLLAAPITWLEYKLIRTSLKQNEITHISINVIIFLAICGFVAVYAQSYLNNLPALIVD